MDSATILFDVIGYLQDRDVAYIAAGKNVAPGWIGLTCPNCKDPSFHLGVHLSDKFMNCWRCGLKGSIVKFVQFIENCGYHAALLVMQQFPTSDLSPSEVYEPKISPNTLQLPKTFTKEFPQPHLDYLESRGFDAKQLIDDWDLMASYNIGDPKFRYRVIAPIIYRQRMVSFTGRDITGRVSPKYMHCANEDSVIPVKACIYNLDAVTDRAVIVEGPTDAWRIGKGIAVALFGMEFTTRQISKLVNKGLKKVIVMFDAEKEAIKKAKKLAANLAPHISKVEVVELSDGDPGEMLDRDVREIRDALYTSA